jgi:hypothetical protein
MAAILPFWSAAVCLYRADGLLQSPCTAIFGISKIQLSSRYCCAVTGPVSSSWWPVWGSRSGGERHRVTAQLFNRISLIPPNSTDRLPHVEVWGISWNQRIPPQSPPATGIWWNRLFPPPDPTRSHQIPPDPTNIMRLGVKKCFKNVLIRLRAVKKCGYAS